MNWVLSWRDDPRGRALADRHYNRQKVGASGFVPPGRCLVLLTPDAGALWVTSWPMKEYVKHEWAGAWVNSLFRRESGPLSSTLIREAVAATRWRYGEPPELGMVTFIDAEKVKGKKNPGYCYLCAGFEPCGRTKGGLVAVRLPPAAMPPPEAPQGAQRGLFEVG